MAYTRLSPGKWRDDKTGKILNSTTDPNKKAAAPKGSTPAPGNNQQKPVSGPPKVSNQIKNVNQGVKADAAVEDYRNTQETQRGNANQVNPFGSQTVTYDENGRPTVTQTQSAAQSQIRQGDEAISNLGRGLAQSNLQGSQLGTSFNPNLMARTSSGDLATDRARIEDAVYGRLTKDTAYREGLDKQNVEQSLANRGIPYSNDPNSQYQQQMKDFTDKYNNIRADARAQAVQMGGDEYSRNVGINETQRANDYTLQSGTRNQQLGEAQSLSGMGPGMANPNYQGFQGSAYNLTPPSALNTALKTLSQGDQQLANQRLQISKSGGGRGGGSGTSTTDSAFVG